jgi:hypothetical protein
VLRLQGDGFVATGLGSGDLARLPGSDERKVAIAREIWEKTTVNMNWIAEKLWMSAANVSQQLGRAKKAEGSSK